jgi:hypothetical protein
MLNACEKWRNHILYEKPKHYMYRHNGLNWRNACGMIFKGFAVDDTENTVKIINTDTGEEVDSIRALDRLKRKLAAFFLQGREAFFIHNMTIACKENEIPVYTNEHDGIITGKVIPEKLIYNVANEVKLPGLKLDIKLICSDDKWNNFKNYLSL